MFPAEFYLDFFFFSSRVLLADKPVKIDWNWGKKAKI